LESVSKEGMGSLNEKDYLSEIIKYFKRNNQIKYLTVVE